MDHHAVELFMLLLILATGAQWLAWKLHVPAIILLSAVGILLGPGLDVLNPHNQMGDMLGMLVSMAVAVILFDGGLSLKFSELREIRRAVWQLVWLGGFLSWVLITLAAVYVAGLSWGVSIVFGGILVVTGPTVIIPLLRQAKLNSRVASVLKWEGIVVDPVGAMFAVIAYEFLTQSSMQSDPVASAIDLTVIILFIAAASAAFGRAMVWLMRDDHLPEFLKAPVTLTAVVTGYVMANMVLEEGGLIAVTVLGMVLANSKISSVDEIRRIKEYLSIILISFLFILLTATLTVADIQQIGLRDILFILAMIVVVRPLVVAMSTKNTSLSLNEKILVGCVAPRGVVLVAICGLLGPALVEAGFEDGARMVPLSFAVVLSTVLIYGFSLKTLATKLKLTATKSGGVLIVGANPLSSELALLLKEHEVPVLLADHNWHHLRQARLASVPVHYGEIASEEAEHNIEFNPYSFILAATDNFAYNTLVCSRFAHEFGRNGVVQLASDKDDESDPKAYSHTLRGRTLIGENASYDNLMAKHLQGWEFASVQLTDEFSYADFVSKHGDHAMPVLSISGSGRLYFNSAQVDFNPPEGHSLVFFAPTKDQRTQAAQKRGRTAAANKAKPNS